MPTMNDAQFERQRARVIRRLAYWKKRLWLGAWEITLVYERGNVGLGEDGRDAALMETNARHEYLRATITICLPEVAKLSAAALDRVLIHELCHCLVQEMRYWDKDHNHEERVVSHLTMMLAYAFEVGWAVRGGGA